VGMIKADVLYAKPGENDLDPTFCMVGDGHGTGVLLSRASSFSL